MRLFAGLMVLVFSWSAAKAEPPLYFDCAAEDGFGWAYILVEGDFGWITDNRFRKEPIEGVPASQIAYYTVQRSASQLILWGEPALYRQGAALAQRITIHHADGRFKIQQAHYRDGQDILYDGWVRGVCTQVTPEG